MRDTDATFVELAPAPDRATDAMPVDRSTGTASPRGFFAFASTSLKGLPLAFWILAAYLFLQTTHFDEEWAAIGRLRPRLVLGGLALAITAMRYVSRARVRDAPRPEHRATTLSLAAFAVAGAFCMLWAFDPALAKDAQVELTTTILGYFLILAIVRTRREVVLTILVLCASCGLYLARSLLEWFAGKYDFKMGVVRMLGAGTSLSDPNSFAATIAFSLPLIVWCAVRTRSSLVRVGAIAYGAVAAYCVNRTNSRSGLALLALNALFFLAMLPTRRMRIGFAIAFVALGAWAVDQLKPEELARMRSIGSSRTYTAESSTAGRIEGYRVAGKIFADNPVTGVGPGNWSAYRVRRVDGDPLMPHNVAGQLIATMGLLGTLPFVAFLFAAFALAIGTWARRRRLEGPWDRAVASLAAVVAFTLGLHLVSGLAAHNLERVGWYLLPAILAVAVRAPREDAVPVVSTDRPGRLA